MKPFSLNNVLRYRKQLENTAAIKLAEAQRVLRQTRDAYDEIDRQYNTLLDDLQRHQETGIEIEMLRQYENHLNWLHNRREQVFKELDSAVANVRTKRDIAVSRSRDRQAMEKLKTRQDNAWRNYIEKKEAAHLDEIAVLSHDRKQQHE